MLIDIYSSLFLALSFRFVCLLVFFRAVRSHTQMAKAEDARGKLWDVVIVGAGLSGLYCANELIFRKPNLQIAVVEARDRVGGKTWTIDYEGDGIDIGGQWVGPKQPLVLSLIDEFRIETVRQPWFDDPAEIPASSLSHKNYIHQNGLTNLNSGSSLPLLPHQQQELTSVVKRIEEMAHKLTEPPFLDVPEAKEWDHMSVSDFLKANVKCPKVLRELELFVRTVNVAEPSEMNFLHYLYFVKCCGSCADVGDGEGGAQTWKLKGGAQQMSIRLAEKLERKGVKIFLSSPVASVTLTSDHLYQTLTRAHCASFLSHQVVVALSPPLYNDIHFHPPLPPAKQELSRRMFMGGVVKTICIFDAPFWKEIPFPTTPLETTGPVANLFPAVVAGNAALAGLVGGDIAHEFAKYSDEERQEAVIAQYEKYFQIPLRNRVKYFTSKDWMSEEFSKGCFAAWLPPLGMAGPPGHQFRRKYGGIHFACSEIAKSWPCYFEGALDSGKRVADDVLWGLAHPDYSLSDVHIPSRGGKGHSKL